jgi:N6-adenosine-specific RNA methylase IME4
MSIDELCKIPVDKISDKDSVLFLWVTSPKLNLFLQLMTSWGYDYKTSFVWDKIKHNMGHYNSVRHEFLLIGGKGKSAPDIKELFDSVQSIERSDKHSEKPIEFMNIIDTLYTHGERIELFCRDQKKENWFFWGNEC